MDIYLMRHFKVNFKWKKKYTSKEFKIACQQYDNANIIKQNITFHHKKINIYISELTRSNLTYETLDILTNPTKTNLINEVPIAPFINTNFKIPTTIWMLFGRLQWYFNIKKQPETKRDTLNKIENFLNELEKEKNDILIIGHGFYFSQLKIRLKKMKYSGKGKSYYKNGEIIHFKKIDKQ